MYLANNGRVVLSPLILAIDLPTTKQLSTLFENENISTIAFQSVLVSAIQILERVREEEIALSKAAISLAHRQQLSQFLASIDSLIHSLKEALNNQGSSILDLQPRDLGHDSGDTSWWFCLASAIETLNAGCDWIKSIISGQREDSPSRQLSGIVVQFLEEHRLQFHNELQL